MKYLKRKAILVILFNFIVCQLVAQSNDSIRLINLREIVCNEINTVNLIFNRNVFTNHTRDILIPCHDSNFFITDMKVETVSFKSDTFLVSIDLIEFSVVLNGVEFKNLYNRRPQNSNNDTFNFVVLSGLTSYYKLLGFYQSDIKLFEELRYHFVRNALGSKIEELNILTKEKAAIFMNTLAESSSEYPTEIGFPSQFLAKYFDADELRFANTKILPFYPLEPTYIYEIRPKR